MFWYLLLGVLQGSILRALLFKIFMNDLFHFIKDTEFQNFANYSATMAFSYKIDDLILNSYKLQIDNEETDLENSMALLGIKVYSKLNFEIHVAALSKGQPQVKCSIT